jgi:hypothetical protein
LLDPPDRQSESWFEKLREGHEMIIGIDMLFLGLVRLSLAIVGYTLDRSLSTSEGSTSIHPMIEASEGIMIRGWAVLLVRVVARQGPSSRILAG